MAKENEGGRMTYSTNGGKGVCARNRKIQLALILLITALAYANILQNGFVWDDEAFILEWKEIRSFRNIPQIFQGALPEPHTGTYRPVARSFFVFSYYLFGTEPFGYHLLSIIIHLSCTILVFLIVLQMTRRSMLALMASLLFGVHPIHTQAIAWITASYDIIGIAFFLASFYFYLKATDEKEVTKRKIFIGLSLLLALLAFLSYELALTLPLIILFHRLCFKESENQKPKGNNQLAWKKIFPAAYLILLTLYIFIRFIIIEIPVRHVSYIADSAHYNLITMIKVMIKYIYFSFLPFNLSMIQTISGGILPYYEKEHQLSTIIAQSIFDVDIITSLLVIAVSIFFLLFYWKRRPILSFFIGWFFISLLPVLNIIPNGLLFAEKYAYLPSLAVCLLLSHVVCWLYGRPLVESSSARAKYTKVLAVIIFVSLCLFYFHQTYERNKDFHDDLSLWEKTLQQVPNSAFASNNLAYAHLKQGNHDQALKYFKRAIQLNPSFTEYYWNVGEIYLEVKKEYDSAFFFYSRILENDPNHLYAHYKIAVTYMKQNKAKEAVRHYLRCLELLPDNAALHYQLATAYLADKNYSASLGEYKEVLQLNSSHAAAYKAIGVILLNKNKYQSAAKFLNRSILLDPTDAKTWDSLGSAYYYLNQTQRAITAWQSSLEMEEDERIRENIYQLRR